MNALRYLHNHVHVCEHSQLPGKMDYHQIQAVSVDEYKTKRYPKTYTVRLCKIHVCWTDCICSHKYACIASEIS